MADKGNCGEKRKRTNLTRSAKSELLKKLDVDVVLRKFVKSMG